MVDKLFFPDADNKIIIICLPSHTTHALQPCDVGAFGPLAQSWKRVVTLASQSLITIKKNNLLYYFDRMFTGCDAWRFVNTWYEVHRFMWCVTGHPSVHIHWTPEFFGPVPEFWASWTPPVMAHTVVRLQFQLIGWWLIHSRSVINLTPQHVP